MSEQGACKSTKKQGALPPRAPGAPFRPGESGNPAGRPKGGVSSVLRMAREAAETIALPKLIEAAREGDREACRILCAIGIPRQKPVSVAEAVPLPDTDDMGQVLRGLLRLIASGELSPTLAAEIAAVVGAAVNVEEKGAAAAQLEKLTAFLERRESLDAGRDGRRSAGAGGR